MANKSDTPCVILCGGKSSRMGEDKALLPYENFKTLIEYQIHQFQQHFKNVYVSVKKNYSIDANYINDAYEVFAPSNGIISSFDKLKSDSIFFIAVDMLFFTPNFFERLCERVDENLDAIIATQNNDIHPLCGIYNKKSIQLLKTLHTRKSYKMKFFLDKIETLYISFDKEITFANLNYKEDYRKHYKENT